MTWLDDILTAYRDHGLTVKEPTDYNWRAFGVGDWTYGKPVATLKHHFVIRYGTPDSNGVQMLRTGYNTGSYFLKPPVVNTYLGQTGFVYPIAGRVAQHGGRGVRAVLERAMNDQPCRGDAQQADDYDGASFAFWGTECHHPGDATPMPDAQYSALVRMSAAECQAMGWSANRVIQHRESTSRKQDIHRGAVNADTLRSQVAAILAGGKPPVIRPTTVPDKPAPQPAEDEDMALIIGGKGKGSLSVIFGDQSVTMMDPESIKALQAAGVKTAELSGRDYDRVRQLLNDPKQG